MRAVPSEEYVYRSARTIKYACPRRRSGERSDLYPANEYFVVDPRRPDEDGNRLGFYVARRRLVSRVVRITLRLRPE